MWGERGRDVSGKSCFEGVRSTFGMGLCIPVVSSIAQYADTYDISKGKPAFHYLPFMGM